MPRPDNRQIFLDLFNASNKENILSDFELKEELPNDKFKILHIKCGTETISHYNDFLRHKNCSNKNCIIEKRNQTRIEKYGSLEKYSEQMVNNVKKTKKEKYGNENFNNSDKGVREKFLNLFPNNVYHYDTLEENGGDYSLLNQESVTNYSIRHETCGTVFSVHYFNFIMRGDRCPECAKTIRRNWYDKKTEKEKSNIASQKKESWNNQSEEEKQKRISSVKNWYQENEQYVKTTKVEKTKQTISSDPLFYQKNIEKQSQTYKEKTGFDHPMHNPEIVEQFKGSNNMGANIVRKRLYESFGLFKNSTPSFTLEDYIGQIVNREIKSDQRYIRYPWVCKLCGNQFEDYIHSFHEPKCPKCFPNLTGTSEPEIKMREFIQTLIPCESKFYYEPNKDNKKVRKFGIDAYVESKNVGFELDGIYSHSEGAGGKDRTYHLDKTNYFKEKGISIIHIYDFEWLNKQEIIKSMIKHQLGLTPNKIHTRKCIVKNVSIQDSYKFLNENHVQGQDRSSIRLGLYYKEELVSLMTFSKPRFNKQSDWELVRFCNKINHSIVGSFSKLLGEFRKNNKGVIVSYADLRLGTGGIYRKHGFNLSSVNPPQFYYTKGYKFLENRMNYQKKNIRKKFPENYKDELTEWENMQMNGYDRVWDCGTLTFVLE